VHVRFVADDREFLMTAPEIADEPVPSWWNPSGDRKGINGFGALEDGYLRQSEPEALAWATAKRLTPSAAGLRDEEIEPIRIYSDGVSHVQINANFYNELYTPINKQLRASLSRTSVPDPVIVWRGAGFKLYRYPEEGPPLDGSDLRQAVGRVFDHRPPISSSVGNAVVPKGAVQPVWYKLRVRQGVRGLFIPEVAVKGFEEQELLLAPGARVLIDSAQRCGERWYILATALS
jgi:hypothetical protein